MLEAAAMLQPAAVEAKGVGHGSQLRRTASTLVRANSVGPNLAMKRRASSSKVCGYPAVLSAAVAAEPAVPPRLGEVGEEGADSP